MIEKKHQLLLRRAFLGLMLIGALVLSQPGGAEEPYTHKIQVKVLGFMELDGEYQKLWGTNERYHVLEMQGSMVFNLLPNHTFKRTSTFNTTVETITGSFTPDMKILLDFRYERTSYATHNKHREKRVIHIQNVPLTETGTAYPDGQQTKYTVWGEKPVDREQVRKMVRELIWDYTHQDGFTVHLKKVDWDKFVDRPDVYMKPVGIGALAASRQLPGVDVDIYEFFAKTKKPSAQPKSGKSKGKSKRK